MPFNNGLLKQGAATGERSAELCSSRFTAFWMEAVVDFTERYTNFEFVRPLSTDMHHIQFDHYSS